MFKFQCVFIISTYFSDKNVSRYNALDGRISLIHVSLICSSCLLLFHYVHDDVDVDKDKVNFLVLRCRNSVISALISTVLCSTGTCLKCIDTRNVKPLF
jgi:hypothetical protein